MSDAERSLVELEAKDDFVRRHIGPGEPQIQEMLGSLGLDSLDGLIDKTVPAAIRSASAMPLPPVRSEKEALEAMRAMADKNQVMVSMIGMGYSNTVVPGVIVRRVLENPGWYTAYTPYQAEVSQGRLEALLNYQQMIIDLTGMELANASLLDEATAAAEAMAMAHRVAKSKSDSFFVAADCHPQTLAVLQTRARPMGIDLIVGDPETGLAGKEVFGALLQYPGSFGHVRDLTPVIEKLHEQKALAVVAADLLALTMITPPGEMGADVVVGTAQRFGVPLGYGGPHAAYFATRDAYKRSVPGRLIGVSVDAEGRPALRMALQTREQHIRREKATSNICTAQVLLAIIAGLYATYHGPDGLTTIAGRVHRLTGILAAGLGRLGFAVENETFFDTLSVSAPGKAEALVAAACEAGINLRLIDGDRIGMSLDEVTTREHVERLLGVFAGGPAATAEALEGEAVAGIPGGLRRQSEFLTHPVFHLYHAETEMMRYLRRLQAKDIALDRSMIALGSCTMKLNATTEMEPVTWSEFSDLHPFAPLEQAAGYRQLFEELEGMLCAVTGFDAISLQPNAGSQGEYAGLMTICKYHESRGDTHRDICLIPSSAHGTNPASATMAGLKVVVVACDDQGNVDVEDLKAKAEQHRENLAALMVTYPSTHGVFEEAIRDICAIIHDNGGQVYMDGANLNALLGVCKPGEIGADVSHMNLHKTFCIPHGGGGPGMGPIGVMAHLAPFLPDHPVVPGVNPAAGAAGTIGAVSAAPWGSSSILPISWAYIAMMGADGLTRATQLAILNANYIAARLAPHYPVLYTGQNGMVAHECIIDFRPIKEACGISVEDVAKRLVDYGFHAPTMSFPVADTLMIEPTESEAKREIDRFCDAMIAIRHEIAEVESGAADAGNNVLHNAPHTHHLLMAETWDRPYDKQRAFFPLPGMQEDKYWPPVARIDNVAGDRNLVCTCPPMEAYQQAAE
ncbi:aminomethyl-transferring glycine dehydrogenase [Pelagibius litoralis]|uniref:Glycine dehydrogenase (decarboxylating) n=1 Tax=Pelagibius litoralis TaxID=374515 RepID=A0A967F1Z6_9PROT|nr:aminomethyl-transferring glycine dehydrogenase [Pelagibius litoralis]NIA71572.1 aminomethyl-transferring glycine dehydrogenase [Pelagibius litoralis]